MSLHNNYTNDANDTVPPVKYFELAFNSLHNDIVFIHF